MWHPINSVFAPESWLNSWLPIACLVPAVVTHSPPWKPAGCSSKLQDPMAQGELGGRVYPGLHAETRGDRPASPRLYAGRATDCHPRHPPLPPTRITSLAADATHAGGGPRVTCIRGYVFLYFARSWIRHGSSRFQEIDFGLDSDPTRARKGSLFIQSSS
jgi:hypothetical protein